MTLAVDRGRLATTQQKQQQQLELNSGERLSGSRDFDLVGQESVTPKGKVYNDCL